MFQVGDQVVYSLTGVCTIVSIGPLSMSGVDRSRLYYTLQPVYASGVVYVPMGDGAPDSLRWPISREEAERLLERIPDIEPCAIQNFNYKQRTDAFSAALHENDCDGFVKVIKAIEAKKRRGREKQQYNSDSNYHKRAMNLLCGELAFALDLTLDQARARVEEALQAGCVEMDA